jgi:hypothetical protein
MLVNRSLYYVEQFCKTPHSNILRDSYSSYVGHPPLLSYMAVGMGEPKEKVRTKPHGMVLLLSLNHWRTHVSQPVFVLC